MKLFLVLALLAACRSTHAEGPREPDPRCSMIEAAVAVDDAAFQRFYRGDGCGESAGRDGGRLIVDVQGLQLKDTDSCPSKRFTVFNERRTRTSSHQIVQLTFSPLDDGRTWAFYASYLDPPSHLDDRESDGFDHVEYYCHLISGRVAREPGGWRAWVERDEPASPTDRRAISDQAATRTIFLQRSSDRVLAPDEVDFWRGVISQRAFSIHRTFRRSKKRAVGER